MLRVNTYKRKITAGENQGRHFFFGRVVMDGQLSFDELCENISHFCTVTKPDIAGVLTGMLPIIGKYLLGGDTVQFDDLGTLRLVSSSYVVEEEEDFHTSLMKPAKVLFTPGRMLREAAQEATFTRNTQQVRPAEPCPFGHD